MSPELLHGSATVNKPSWITVPGALLAALVGCGGGGSQASTPSTPNPPTTPPTTPTTPTPTPTPYKIKLDLSYVDKGSAQYSRFKQWVDTAVSGNPGYAFSAYDAALMHRLDGRDAYCNLAVSMTEQEVAAAESAMASGRNPQIASDSYLEVGPRLSALAMTYDSCHASLTASQKDRWSRFAEQAVFNVWNPPAASWQGRSAPWSGWSIDNPGNNYYYSFVEATMYWGLASESANWKSFLANDKLPAMVEYFRRLPGGGSREGTGYGTSHMRLFALYQVWRDATGTDLANQTTHARDSIDYWVHATVPTLDRFAPIGDQSRNSMPELYDYHRSLILEARYLTNDANRRSWASWWLNNISVQRMAHGFNSSHDLLPAGTGSSPTPLLHHATGVGHAFVRTGWDRAALWLNVVAGPYDESHAHQEQGSFTLFAGDWLVVPANVWSHSGIRQETTVHNMLRFERSNTSEQQCQSPANDVVVHQCTDTVSTMAITQSTGRTTFNLDLTPAYRGAGYVQSWRRTLDLNGRVLVVRDSFATGAGTQAIFQLTTPAQPVINGTTATAGRLQVRVLKPDGARLTAVNWRNVPGSDFSQGWRLDVSGGSTEYEVELRETN